MRTKYPNLNALARDLTVVSIMPRLDDRLKAVARQVRCHVHADIGSDHAHLLKALLTSGRIQCGIAIENKTQPFEHSRATLADLNAEVRLADGLAGLQSGEADSLSICGMGAESMVKILTRFPDRIPPSLYLQPNNHPEVIRRWGLKNGFHLTSETVADGHWSYVILTYRQSESTDDPAYQNGDQEASLLFGPHIIRQRDSVFVTRLQEERNYLEQFQRLNAESQHRLNVIRHLLHHSSAPIRD